MVAASVRLEVPRALSQHDLNDGGHQRSFRQGEADQKRACVYARSVESVLWGPKSLGREGVPSLWPRPGVVLKEHGMGIIRAGRHLQSISADPISTQRTGGLANP